MGSNPQLLCVYKMIYQFALIYILLGYEFNFVVAIRFLIC